MKRDGGNVGDGMI